MNSIITGQKIARRRTIADRGAPRNVPSKPRARPAAVPSRPLTPLPTRTNRTRTGRSASLAGLARKALDRVAGRIAGLGPGRVAAIGLAIALLSVFLYIAVAAVLRGPVFPMPDAALLPEDEVSATLLLEYGSPELAGERGAYADDSQDLPPPPATLSYSTYTVRSGDTLGGIAKRFGLSMDSLISANGISNARAIRSGASLRIPSMDGLVHRVRSGESISSVAKLYKIDATRLVDANDLGSSTLVPGQSLFIPGARMPEAELKQVLGEKIAWPARGPLSSYFGYRPDPFTGVRRFHSGIDIVMNTGTPIRAAAAGVVSDVGYNATYGNYIILSHGGGMQTLYGHLSSSAVAKGAKVAQGSMIALSGNTGYSTGPHLHFGLFKNGVGVNPLKYLK